MENYYNKAGGYKAMITKNPELRNPIMQMPVEPTPPNIDKYGRMEHNYVAKNWIQKLLAIPRKVVDVVVGPHKCGIDQAHYSDCQSGCIYIPDNKFQSCLLKYRKKRKPTEQIAMFGSIGLALYGIYWLGTITKK